MRDYKRPEIIEEELELVDVIAASGTVGDEAGSNEGIFEM